MVLLGQRLLLKILLAPFKELVSALALPQVLNLYVQILFDLLVADDALYFDTDGSLVDLEDAPGPAVVRLVWHFLGDGRVDDDVDVIAIFVLLEVGRDVRKTVLADVLLKLGTSAAAETFALHGVQKCEETKRTKGRINQ